MAAIPIPRFYIRASILVFALIALCLIDFLFTKRDLQYQLYNDRGGSQLPLAGSNGNARDRRLRLLADRLDLTEGQCKELFPGLTWNVDENVKKGKFGFKRSDPDYKGLVQGRIHKNKVRHSHISPSSQKHLLTNPSSTS
jgi:hypothetical protein